MEEKNFGPVRFIPGINQGRYPACHSVYIEGAGVLIDPASDRDRLERLRDEEGVKAVWLSHWHEDHIAHLDLFEDFPLLMSAADAPPLDDLETFLDWYDMDHDQYRQAWRDIMVKDFHFRPRRPTGILTPGQVVDLGRVTVEIIGAPGHTPGSLAFLFREPGVLFMVDYDLTPFGSWYGDRYSDIDQTIETIGRLRQIPAKVWLTGHETGIFEQDPGELWDKYLAVIDAREEKLEKFLAEPRTMDEIIQAWIVYGRPREPREFFWFGEKAIIGKHLQRLEAQGRLVMDGERYRLK
jgi:glyoxylase-like metal-dependent hydrolase (beta-lactamase superfamily II)